jgi:hypothetical protein
MKPAETYPSAVADNLEAIHAYIARAPKAIFDPKDGWAAFLLTIKNTPLGKLEFAQLSDIYDYIKFMFDDSAETPPPKSRALRTVGLFSLTRLTDKQIAAAIDYFRGRADWLYFDNLPYMSPAAQHICSREGIKHLARPLELEKPGTFSTLGPSERRATIVSTLHKVAKKVYELASKKDTSSSTFKIPMKTSSDGLWCRMHGPA